MLLKQLPNIITGMRILAIPLVMFLMQWDSVLNAFWASIVFAAASITDALDGYLARKFKVVSLIGKFLDPLADKLIVMGSLLMLLHLSRVSAWIVFVLLARETMITTLRSIAVGEGIVIDARDLGKLKTAFQMVGLWALLMHYPYPFDFLPEPVDFHRIGTFLLYISLALSIISALDYGYGFVKGVRLKPGH